MENDITLLNNGLLGKADFVSKYGEDEYLKAIGVQVTEEAPEPTIVQEPEQTLGQKALSTMSDIAVGVANGVEQAINETAQTVNSMGEAAEDALGVGRLVWEDKDGDGETDILPSYWSREKVEANQSLLKQDAITAAAENLDVIPEAETVAGGMVEGVSQFLTGFIALGGARTFAGAMIKGGIVDATVFDPYEGNLSNLVQEYPHLQNPITEVLALDPNDPEWYNRAKNALEGGIAGTALEGLIRGVKFVSIGRKANAEIKELGELSDETAAQLDEAHLDIAEFKDIQALEDLPVVGPKSDLPEPAVIPTAPKIELIDTAKMQEAMARSIEMGDFELRNIDEGGWFNLSRMEGPVEAAKVVDSMQEVLMGSRGAKAMGLTEPETHDQVVRKSLEFLADNTATDVNKIIRDLGVTESVSRDMAARIVAGKVALQSTGREISAMAKKVEAAAADKTLTAEMETQLVDMMQMHVELQANVKGLQTAAARATSAGRIATADQLTGDTLDRLAAFGGSERVRNLAKEMAKITDDAQLSRTIKKAVDRKALRVLNEYWINSILSGPTTHALNMTSNAINVLARPAERVIGAGLRADTREMKAALRTYYYMFGYMGDAIRLAAKSGYEMRPILDESVKFDNIIQGSNRRAISSDVLGFGGSTMDMLGKILTIPSRMLGLEDEFFKQLAYRSSLQARLVTDAAYMSIDDIKKAGYNTRDEWVKDQFDKAFISKIDAEEAYEEAVMLGKVADDPEVKAEFIKQSVGGSKTGNEYASIALLEAREATFTTPLKEGTMSYNVQVLANKHPFLRQIIPFIQTPMNIMAQAWDRTPALNLLRGEYRTALKSDDPTIRAQALGKLATGTAIYGVLAQLAFEDRITGGGPSDPKIARLWKASPDWQPYSINFGTKEKPYWVSYARMDPWTTAFGIVGDMKEMIQLGQMADQDQGDMAAMFIAAVGNNIVSKTYLQGIADTVDLMNAKDSPWEVGNFFKRRMASLVPFSSLGGQTGRLTDDYMREVRSYTDQLKQQTGIMRNQLPLKYNWITGQPVETPETLGGFFHITTKGVEEKETEQALISSEMRKLGVRFEGARRKVRGVELTAEQYQRWNQLIGTTTIGRRNLQERLTKVINSERYNKDGNDYNLVTPSESHRVLMLNRDIKRYRDRAFRDLMQEYPVIKEQIRAYDRFVKDTQRGREAERPEVNLENID
jgi:hypothetical protein